MRGVLTSGLRTTRQSLVNKKITMKAGDPLSPVEEADIQRRLYDLGIFARVNTAIENPDGDTDHKYVLYNFEEANRYTLGIGVGAQVARFGQPSAYSLGVLALRYDRLQSRSVDPTLAAWIPFGAPGTRLHCTESILRSRDRRR